MYELYLFLSFIYQYVVIFYLGYGAIYGKILINNIRPIKRKFGNHRCNQNLKHHLHRPHDFTSTV